MKQKGFEGLLGTWWNIAMIFGLLFFLVFEMEGWWIGGKWKCSGCAEHNTPWKCTFVLKVATYNFWKCHHCDMLRWNYVVTKGVHNIYVHPPNTFKIGSNLGAWLRVHWHDEPLTHGKYHWGWISVSARGRFQQPRHQKMNLLKWHRWVHTTLCNRVWKLCFVLLLVTLTHLWHIIVNANWNAGEIQ